MRKTESVTVFLIGGILYNLIELLWRGYTHWSMTLAGGMALLFIHIINRHFHHWDILLRCLLGCLMITGIEFAVGIVVNLWLGLDVWDYSGMALNVLGQICPAFSMLWFLISFPACVVSDGIHRFYHFLEKRERTVTV